MTAVTLRIATRQSQLALWQANFVKSELERRYPDYSIELVSMTTQGDRQSAARLADVGGKGLFIKELEQALLDDRADLAVHSVKDLPARLPAQFSLPVLGYRADVRDVLVSRDGAALAGLAPGSRIGTSSLRRAFQVLLSRADVDILPIRGNVDTRLAKLDAGDYDAIVLAAAGITRLGLGNRVSEYLSTDIMLPAAGQGALGIECLSSRTDVLGVLEPLNDLHVSRAVSAERLVCAGLGATCTTPLGAFAETGEAGVRLRAVLAMPDGSRVMHAEVHRAIERDATHDWSEDVAAEIVRQLASKGAESVMQALKALEA